MCAPPPPVTDPDPSTFVCLRSQVGPCSACQRRPPVTDPDPSTFVCLRSQVGPCSACQRRTWKYGHGGSPLCQWCAAPVLKQWGPHVRYLSTRP
ncbi:hypothetical protein [Streptomyces sp. NPDC001500]